jgi:hypothetical protein
VTGRDGWFVAGYRRDLESDAAHQALRALGRLLLAEPDKEPHTRGNPYETVELLNVLRRDGVLTDLCLAALDLRPRRGDHDAGAGIGRLIVLAIGMVSPVGLGNAIRMVSCVSAAAWGR